MKLVIEREGGFNVIKNSEWIVSIDVQSVGVAVNFESDGNKWVEFYPTTDHAAACQLSAAIAVRCGELVEPLAEAPSNGLEDAEDDDAMGAVMAGRVREAASEWVDGEPPRTGMAYVAQEGVNSLCVRWDGERWRMGMLVVELGAGVAHLPTPIPPR